MREFINDHTVMIGSASPLERQHALTIVQMNQGDHPNYAITLDKDEVQRVVDLGRSWLQDMDPAKEE